MQALKTILITTFAALTFSAGSTAFAGSYEEAYQVQPQAQIMVVDSTGEVQHKHRSNGQHAQHRPVWDKAYFKKHRVIYRVRPGDSLNKIAYKTGVSVQRLVKLNKLYGNKKNRLLVGQVLHLR